VTRRRVAIGALIVAATSLVLGRVGADVYVDYQWYAALGATSVWMTRVINLSLMRGVSVLAVALFVLANLYAVRRSIIKVVVPRRMGDLEIGEEVPGRYLDAAVIIGAVVIGLVLGLPQHGWTQLVLARTGMPFGDRDKYFDVDLGFFVYQLPLEAAIYVRAVTTVLVVIAVVVCLYFLFTPGLRWERVGLRMSTYVRRHLAVLALVVYWAAAWSYRLDMYGVLTDGSGVNGAFTYADHKAIIPLDLVMCVAIAGAGVAILFVLWKGQLRTALVITSLAVIVHLVAFKLVPSLVNQFAAVHDPAVREQPYVAIRALYTRTAFGADQLHDSTAGLRLATPAEIARTVPVWDPAALTVAVERTGGRRTAAVDSAVDWTNAPNGPVATAVARGGPSMQNVADHGIGIRVSGTATDEHGGIVRVDAAGRPDATDLPLAPIIVRPGAAEPLVVADSTGRIMAAPVDGWLARLAHAWSAQNLRLLGEELPEPNPRLVSRRDVRVRIDALAPFFVQGSSVWPGFVGDTVYWIVDLYSASRDYPLSDRYILAGAERSYFRHAATAFVDASTGRVLLARDASLDPIAQTWVNQFPGLFVRWDQVAPALVAATPPRVDGALGAARAFHPRTGGHAATLEGADSVLAAGPVPCFALPSIDAACAWSIPLVDASDRVAGLVITTGGPQPSTFWYRAEHPGRAWPELLERLEHPSDTAGGSGAASHVIRGNVRAVPGTEGVTFVQPQYTWGPDAPPTLARVIVVTPDRAGTGHSVADAEGLVPPVAHGPTAPATPAEFRSRVAALYEQMQSALRRSDLTAFGVAFTELGQLLRRPNP
jgi:uncharacterized membrane protein (UPF0182 family)